MSVPITTRTAKGSPLLTAEMDANLTALQSGIDTVLSGIESAYTFDPTATVAQIAAAAARGVALQAAASSGKQSFRSGVVSSSALTSVAAFTRATAAWCFDQSGVLAAFSSGAALVNTAGLSVYPARTNSIRNPTGLGFVAGDLSTTGLLPTNWGNAGAGGLTITVVGAATMNGIPGVLVRYSGTPTSTTQIRVGLESPNTQIPASVGQAWTGDLWWALNAGSLTNVTSPCLDVFFRDSGGTAAFGNNNTSAALTSALSRLTMPVTAPASAAYVCMEFRASITTGQAVDFTVFLGAPQLKLGADIQDPPILQTNNAAATRNADVPQVPTNIPVGQAFTITGRLIAPLSTALAAGPVLFDLAPASGSADGVQVTLDTGSGGRVLMAATSAGLPRVGLQAQTITPGAPVGFAVSCSGDTLTLSVNGQAAASGIVPGGAFAQALTRLFLGCNSAGGGQLGSTIRDLNVIMRAMSSAELAVASDASLERDLDFTTQTYKYLGDAYSAGITDLPGTTFSRAGAGNTLTVAGWLLNFASGAVRATDAGLTIEPATTNVVLWNRDLTNAVWVGSNMTAAKDQQGVDGASNAASSILATAANASILQAITLASSQRAQSAFVRRITGSGAVSMTTDGGATWTAITVGANWAQVSIPAQTLANPSVGFKLATSGDKIAVDFVQNEQNSYATSPLGTTTATVSRPADVLATIDIAPTSFSVSAKVTIPPFGSGVTTLWCWSDGTNNNRFRVAFDWSVMKLQVFAISGGVTQVGINASGVLSVGQTVKIACAFAANDFACSVNGGVVTTGATLTMPTLTTFTFGQQFGTNDQWGSGIQSIKRWRGRRTNAQLVLDAT
jgi:hypothetical protein